MTYQQAKGSIKSYIEEHAVLNILMKISPILIFLRPVANLLTRMMEDSYSARGFSDFLLNMDALFTILFVVGLVMCFIDEKGLPMIGALVLYLVDLFIWLFGTGKYGYIFNPLVYTLFYLGVLAAAIIMTARNGGFQHVADSTKKLLAPRPQPAPMVVCSVCNQLNAVGVNFCTNCGSEMPPPPVQQPIPQAVATAPAYQVPTPPPAAADVPAQPPAQAPILPTVDAVQTAALPVAEAVQPIAEAVTEAVETLTEDTSSK